MFYLICYVFLEITNGECFQAEIKDFALNAFADANVSNQKIKIFFKVTFLLEMSPGSADLPTSAYLNDFLMVGIKDSAYERRNVVIHESRALPLSYGDKKRRKKTFKKLCEKQKK
ncbi:MAG: hypothetical protein AABX84_01290 [Nanoarchaeota archaeon]